MNIVVNGTQRVKYMIFIVSIDTLTDEMTIHVA